MSLCCKAALLSVVNKKLLIVLSGLFSCLDELIRYVNHASCVITDTFHGSVLSMLCNTSFLVKLRGNRNKLEFLLKQHNLENRIIQNMSDICNRSSLDMNFEKVNQTINELRNKSLDFLKNAIG